MKIIESNVEKLRDPFVLVDGENYYMYGTGWVAYRSNGNLQKWEKLPGELVEIPKNFKDNKWAPEVYKYRNAYYMFTTYQSEATKHRGCTILKSEKPEGPFIEISNGHVTPKDWDCIDGTFYIDEEGQPWMIFVHEWVCTEDHVGRMAAAKLSEDLTHLISEPVELFRADEPDWAKWKNREASITDGCFMYRDEADRLCMLWSNFDITGYCVASAHSDNGKVDGKWIHEKELIFSKELSGEYDGGHGMLFRGFDGCTYLAIHSPNAKKGDRLEKPVFIPVKMQPWN